jgi:hypothetical protein
MKKFILTLQLAILFYGHCWAQTILQPADMKYDLAVLKATWENVHGGLYRFITKEELDAQFRLLDKQTNKPLTLKKFFILTSQLNIKLNCSHSFVSYYNNKKALKEELYSNVFMPVLFRVIDNKFVVTHTLTGNEDIRPGDEITAINGYSSKTIIDSLLTVSKADGRNGLNKKLDNINIYQRDLSTKHYCLFDIFFPLFFKQNLNDETYNLTIKRGGKTTQVAAKGLSKADREKAYIAKYGDIPKNEKTWYLKEIDKNTMLFRLGDFTTYNWKFDFKKYLDSVFVVINQKKYDNLIVDIRENEGGADDARDAVLSYLTTKPIGCANPGRRLYRYTSIPDSLLPNLSTWDDGFKKPKEGYVKTADGYYEKQDAKQDCDEINPNPNHFRGKIFLITDATNSSATFIMADCIKRNKLGTLVGEKTGGSQQGINGGQLFFFYLPKSKIEMDVPLIWQRPLVDRPDDGIVPDHEIKTTVADIANRQDAPLQFIMNKLIAKKR